MIIWKVYNSTYSVDVAAFRSFSLDTYMLILDKFGNNGPIRWINISPTVHSGIAHCWELIQRNDGHGLGAYSEQGLEHNNKYLRWIRTNLARKTSQVDNLTDCMSRFWLRSDPIVRAAAPKPKCTRCNEGPPHYTVSCPTKQNGANANAVDPTSDEFILSGLFL